MVAQASLATVDKKSSSARDGLPLDTDGPPGRTPRLKQEPTEGQPS